MKAGLLTLAATLVSMTQAYAISSAEAESTWLTLTPTATWEDGITDYTTTFGIAVVTIASSASASKAKRDVISQIGDGQIQASTSTKSAVSTKKTSTAQAVSQIGDGQIQASTSTSIKKASSTAQAVSQIGDGQIQASTSTSIKEASSTAQAVSQIGDGQIQASTSTAKVSSTEAAVSQITDGQVQASTSTAKVSSTTSGVSQITDGQVQASTSSADASASTTASTEATESTSAAEEDSDSPVDVVSCKTSSSLALTLKDSILYDSAGRIGSIVANRQFQFDGPPPQAGAIYAVGWSITEDGYLAIGDNDVFYQCLSGTFYNLYDESIGGQCTPIHLEAVNLVDC